MRFRETVPARKAFTNTQYWRKPVPGFGDPEAWLVIVGLAPAAHGGNRTGRVFTGDETGRFLVQALYRTGFANQPESVSRDDGLKLKGCFLTATVKCVPPDNKPTREECNNCSRYLDAEFYLLKNKKAILALGKIAFDACLDYVKRVGKSVRGLKFAHGARYQIDGVPELYASYHPTPRNTYTKKLTMEMMTDLLDKIKQNHMPR
ncbi:MAG: uracil-DNA glycosylase [Conexivisphaerales archaeon]